MSDPSLLDAPILHVDLDSFFAAVEVLDDPSLRGKPVAVGGSGERGVVASASYEARRYGVKSAMPSIRAKALCPGLIFVPGRFDRYEEYSGRFHDIVKSLSPVYEPLSLDEVFCDVRSLTRLATSSLEIARELHRRLAEELSLGCGIGVGRNKLFAKLGSKAAKPTIENRQVIPGPGVFYVSPAVEEKWLNTLPARALWGVGPATSRKLETLGLTHIRDIAQVDREVLIRHLGASLGSTLFDFSHGIDDREVQHFRVQKSIGNEETFGESLTKGGDIRAALRRHAGVVSRSLRHQKLTARTVSVVVTGDDLHSASRAQSLSFGIDDESAISEIAIALFETLDTGAAVRHVGIHVRSLVPRERNVVQLSFNLGDDTDALKATAVRSAQASQAENDALRDTLDAIRDKFGIGSVGRGSALDDDGLHLGRQRGSSSFSATQTGEDLE